MSNSTTETAIGKTEIGDVCSSNAAPPFYWLLTLVIGGLAVTGNGLVVVVYILKKVEHNSTNLIITNLAIVDFLSGFFLAMMKSLPRLPKPVGSGFLAQVFCRVYCSEYPLWALLNTSVFYLLLVAVDRYLSVIFPFFHKIKFNTFLVLNSGLAMTWILGIIMAGYNLVFYVVSGEICVIDFSFDIWIFVWSGNWSFFGMLMIPTGLMLLAYGHISYALSKMPENSQGKRQQKKLTISCFAVLAIFFICWFPDQLYFYLYSLNLPGLNLGNWLYHVVLSMGLTNCCLNPFLYAFLNPNYKKVFIKMSGFSGFKVKSGKRAATNETTN
ncbi:mu-type opioid receptor-like [Convolutriloba macropyga]|uniref:mu-type opioid receptor-like n=1 Tax=Convolutriloba macropyga TaxID=536237 RepID=UPI003F5222DE